MFALAMQPEPWVTMWIIAFAVYATFKLATWWPAHRAGVFATGARSAGYLLAWAGMDAEAFARGEQERTVQSLQTRYATLMLLGGMALLVIPAALDAPPFIIAWSAMIGFVCAMHFGLLALIARAWRARGVAAQPIMRAPLLAENPGEFWGKRWNLAFAVPANRWVFRPLARRTNITIATLAAFAFSGVIHDLVISLPARGGHGLPTLYFLLQGVAVLIARSQVGRRFRLRRGWRGRAFTWLVVLAPITLLAHAPFRDEVVLPLAHAMASIADALPHIELDMLIRIGGVLHLGILIASACVPGALAWRSELAKLSRLSRQLIWTHGAFIVLVILAFGLVSLTAAPHLARDDTLARAVCGFIAFFWLARLSLQFTTFDAKPHLTNWYLALGYHALTLVFLALVSIYGYAALQ